MGTPTLLMRLESAEFDTGNFQVIEVKGKEAISRLFSFDIDIVCADPQGIDADALIGALATLVFELDPQDKASAPQLHHVHGMISEVEDMLDPMASYRTYHLRMVPRAHRLTLVQAQEIFLNQSIPDIIRAKLARVGLEGADVDLRLAAYPPREFVVQYKETDLAFISRLAEHLGICFFFEHQSGQDVIVFSDQSSGFRPIEGDEKVIFRPRGETRAVHRLTARSRMIPSLYVVQDYNYNLPHLDLTGQYALPDGYAGGVIENSPNYLTPAEGAALAQVRAEERAVSRRVLAGASDVYRLHAGAKLVLEEHPKFEQTELLLMEVEHAGRQVVHMEGGDEERPFYENTFRAIDARVPYRPERLTPKPLIAGVISAQVEPPPGDTIGNHAQIDAAGRYTVRFFFDPSPLGARSPSSLPVRMAQPHAGPNYGFHFPLKPGIEVLIAFTEGDPDRPFIVGSVPNPVTPSPVYQQNLLFNKFQTASGVFMEIKDV